MLTSLMSSYAFSQGLLQTSIYGDRDTVVKAIFESGRKSKVETVYDVSKYPLTIAYREITKYYRQNDSFVVYSSRLDGSSSAGRSDRATYYDSNFRLIKPESSGSKQDEYIYDKLGRLFKHIMCRGDGTIKGVIENEYHDKDMFFIQRVYRVPYELVTYTKTYYDSAGEYTISYSAPDSSKEWTDTIYHKTYGKLFRMVITGQISNAFDPDPDASIIKNVIHEFDSDNNPIKFIFVDANDQLIKTNTIIYSADGGMLEENTVRANGDTVYRALYFYDIENNLIETRRAEKGSSLNAADIGITTNEYDKMHRLLFRKRGSGDEQTILSNKYDDRGDLIEYKIVEKGVLKMLREYTYEY